MDTRSKIIGLAEAAVRMQAEGLLAVQMDCDPLVLPLAEALEAMGRPVLALLDHREGEYAQVAARAEVAASLACVKCVAIGTLDGETDLRGREREWRRELEDLVRAKSAAR